MTEPEHGPVVARDLEDLPGEEAEAEDGSVLVIVQVAVRTRSEDTQFKHILGRV